MSRVSVLVPVYFHAQGTCLFDRSRESKAASRISGVGISPGDMRVGRLADAFVFGALSILSTSQLALSQVFPELSDDLVRPDRVEVGTAFPKEQQYNEEGVYAVRFWRNNRSRVVVVDDYIPCSQYGKPVFGSFTGSNGKFEIWSLLVEKAYAKLHGGYEAIVGGQEVYCLQDLYGGVPARYKLQEKCPSEEVAWQTISSALQSGSLVGCSNEDMAAELPSGLRKTDAYGVMKLVELDYQGEHTRWCSFATVGALGRTSNLISGRVPGPTRTPSGIASHVCRRWRWASSSAKTKRTGWTLARSTASSRLLSSHETCTTSGLFRTALVTRFPEPKHSHCVGRVERYYQWRA